MNRVYRVSVNRSPVVVALYAWLLLITVISLFFGEGALAPVDSRTNVPIDGVHLSFPVWGSIMEPFTALFHIMGAVPAYKPGIGSILAWIMVIVLISSISTARKNGSTLFSTAFQTFRNAGLALLLLALYVAVGLTTHFPNWALEKDDAELVVADMHSHSLLSHDGIISAGKNLLLHEQRGYDVVAMTDHVNPQGLFDADRVKGEGGIPAVLSGIEVPVYYGAHYYLIGLGMSKDAPLPHGLLWREGTKSPMPPRLPMQYLWDVKGFISTIHHYHGVVITVALHLDASEVLKLADQGVDGFEYINSGHEPLPRTVRNAMLTVQRTKGIPLLASNDWHGWSGNLNAWTLVAPANSQNLMPGDTVLEALRHHDSAHIIPAVSFPVHPMSWFEIITAPFSATFLYAKTLSFWQLLFWWIWAGIFTLMVRSWPFCRISPVRFVMHLFILTAGVLELSDGVTMLLASYSSSLAPVLNLKISCIGVGIGLLLITFESRLLYAHFKEAPSDRLLQLLSPIMLTGLFRPKDQRRIA